MDDVVGDLRRARIFVGADDEFLRRLSSRTFPRKLRPGQVLFTEGEPSEHLFVVRQGRVRIVTTSARGDELTLSVLAAGDVLGELSVIDRRPRSATAEALDEVRLIAVRADDVRALLTAEPTVLLAAAIELAGVVRRLTGNVADLVFLDLPRRLAKHLLAEAVRAPAGDLRVESGMSQAGLAARLGVTRQTLNRALSGLVRRGWIVVDGPSYRVLDVDGLRRFADS